MSATDVSRAGDADVEIVEAERETTTPEPRRREWTVRRIGALLAPALIYLGIRELGLLVLSTMSAANGYNMSKQLWSWDGQWFIGIAGGGYGNLPNLFDARGLPAADTAMAFFPGYPTAIRFLSGIDGSGGIGPLTAALTITVVSGVLCAYGLARLGGMVNGGSRRTGLILVALFAASPMAIVLSMAYSEAMFCAFAVWALVGVLERRWVLAGLCCAFAGLVRPTAAALILVVGLAALVAVIQRRDSWRPWLGGLVAPVGLIGYLAWVANQTGDWDGWFRLQEQGWDTGFDGGVATWNFVRGTLTSPDYPFYLITAAVIILALVLVVLAIVRRLEWPLLVYGIGVLAMDLASNGLMSSKVRLMVPAFTLLIPVAVALAKRRTSTVVIVLCALAVGSAWLGAYSITSWGFAI